MKSLKYAISLVVALAAMPALAQQAAGSGTAEARVAPVYKTAKLDRARVDALFAAPGNLLVIDLRRPDELTAIGGFPVYLSIQTADLEKSLAYIPRDRQILTVSNHAVRALRAGDLLDARGYKVAGAIGVQDYEAEGGTLKKIAPPPPRTAAAAAR